MTGRSHRFHLLDEIAKIGNHLRRAASEIDNWNVSVCEPLNDTVDCLAIHDLLPLWAGVHVTMHAREIAELTHIDLKNFRTPTTKLQTCCVKSTRESVHINSTFRYHSICYLLRSARCKHAL